MKVPSLSLTAAPPAWVTVSVSGDQSQPFPAGSLISVSCISGGGKPRPTFTWRLGEEEILDHSEEGDETEARSEVTFTLEEEHDGLEIECLSVSSSFLAWLFGYNCHL